MKAHNYNDVKEALATLEPFKHSTCSGEWYESFDDVRTGYLSEEHRRTLELSFLLAEQVYVVKSYDTVIGWADWLGSACVPEARYSATTSRQQGLVRAYLKGML